MRSNLRILVAAAAALLVAPVAMADQVEEQLKLMNDRMQQLENQLQATQDQLDASNDQVARQQDVMEKAGLDRKAESGLSGFYQSVEISGWLAGSWFWNFNNPAEDFVVASQGTSQVAGNSVNGGLGNNFYPFHPDHNSFSVDQLWFEIEKPATEESRAGFRADILWGKTASVLGTGLNRLCQGFGSDGAGDDALDDIDPDTPFGIEDECRGDSASDNNLYQAYIQYLTPFGPTVKVGKFATWLGVEVTPTVYNLNITRGNVFNLLQPINHYGVSVEGTNVVDWGIAIVNDATAVDPDFNNAKHIMAKVGYGTEMFSGQLALLWGQDQYGGNTALCGLSDCNAGVVDLILQVDPMENFTAYLNFDYGWRGAEGTLGQEGYGVALAGRYGFTDRLGFALRGEWAQDEEDFFGICGFSFVCDTEIWGITGTVDYTITDNLVLKAEVRYDYLNFDGVQGLNSNVFVNSNQDEANDLFDSDSFTRRSQVVGGFELVYQF